MSIRVLGIIPARKNSKRVPGKNTRILLGKPLIEHVLNAAIRAKLIKELVVTSDDDAVEEIVKEFPSIHFISRPAELASDTSPAIDYVKHVLSLKGREWDYIAIIQPTTPFVRSSDIDDTISLLIASEASSAVSVVKIDQLHHPFKLKVMREKVLLPYLLEEGNIKAAHELPDVFSRNGAIYVTSLESIDQGKIIGEPCLGHVMPAERSVDINVPIDFDFAEFLGKRYSLTRNDEETI